LAVFLNNFFWKNFREFK